MYQRTTPRILLALGLCLFTIDTAVAATSGTGSFFFPPSPPPGNNRLLIGLAAPGTGQIDGGSVVNSAGNNFGSAAYVGVDNGNGILLVTDPGSQLNMGSGNALRIGANAGTATGSVTVQNGGAINLTNEALVVGVSRDAGAKNGSLTIDNATVTVGTAGSGTRSLFVGHGENGGTNSSGIVTLSGNATLTVADNAFFGRGATSNSGQLNINGAGNTFDVGGRMFMNFAGGEGSMQVESGNTVNIGRLTLQGSDVGSGLTAPTGAGTIELVINDLATWNPIDVDTILDLNVDGGSHLLVDFTDGVLPGNINVGDEIDLITYASFTGAPFDTIGTTITDSLGNEYLLAQDSTHTFLQVTSVVPEPASIALWSLLGVALLGVGCVRRTRRGVKQR